MLMKKTWVCSPMCSKANLLTPGYGEGKCSVYCRCQAGSSGQLVLKTPEPPFLMGFMKAFLNTR